MVHEYAGKVAHLTILFMSPFQQISNGHQSPAKMYPEFGKTLLNHMRKVVAGRSERAI